MFTFSYREKAILELVVKGLNNKQIGDVLHISRHTVKKHVTHILNKIGAKNRTHAAYILGLNYKDYSLSPLQQRMQ